MNDSTADKLGGKLDQAKGTAKEKVGQITNDPDLEAEGADDKLGGKVQEKIGGIKKVFEK